ncbi:DUF2911 domain-containing protein [Salmonirosea aquatica]|uniref:DUF2911 domain-containing protein n=1 Tax=Salmonirosea aquatica TaxID=2654236 RepID=A0A7C9BEJ4_9BACT|nr:DUF2911 domain-containing protein [Cytophagaceae bacterium SJW1-29]
MKKYYLAFILVVGLLSTSLAQRTPQPSPAASVMQTVGVTDFTVTYSRPSAKGRTVFGDSAVVSNGRTWRTGANAATTLEASTDFMFGGKKVPAGKYALFSIPQSGQWTVILNKDTQASEESYKESQDAVRVMVMPASASEFMESFTIGFSDVTDSTAYLNIGWGTVNVPVPLAVMTTDITMMAMDKAVMEKPEDPNTLQNAASYMLSKGKNLSQALAMADKSIGLKETFRNVWLKAQILAKMGKVAEAIPLAQKALAMGKTSGDSAFSFMGPQIENGLKNMQAMVAAAATNAANMVKGAKGKKK